jgi:DNA-directed RNA polymerase sigma subunit (sigma70/sigma32)
MSRTLIRKESALKDYLSLVARLPRVSPDAQDAMAARLLAGDAAANLELMESFLPLVVAEAALRRGLGLRFEALIAAGNRGLVQALRDPQADTLQARVRRCVRACLREALAAKAKFRRPA